jgi:hypothetical protein
VRDRPAFASYVIHTANDLGLTLQTILCSLESILVQPESILVPAESILVFKIDDLGPESILVGSRWPDPGHENGAHQE